MTLRPRVNRSVLGLTVSFLGLGVGILFGLVQYPGMWYVLALCALPLPILVFTYRPRPNIRPTLRQEFLPASLAEALLATAIKADRYNYPLCAILGVSRASGTAAAAMTALEIAAGVRNLRDCLNARAGEMIDEQVFNPVLLRKHLAVLRRVHGVVLGLAGSLSAECVREMPTGVHLCTDLEAFAKSLMESAVAPMEDLLSGTAGKDPCEEIRIMITKKVPLAILKLLERGGLITQISAHAESLVKGLRSDWNHEVQETWARTPCKPAEEVPPRPPERVVVYLGEDV